MHKGLNTFLALNAETFMPWRIHAILGHMAPGFQ